MLGVLIEQVVIVRRRRGAGPGAGFDQGLVVCAGGLIAIVASLVMRGGLAGRAPGIMRSDRLVLRAVIRLGVVGGFQKVPFQLTGMLLESRRIIAAGSGEPVY